MRVLSSFLDIIDSINEWTGRIVSFLILVQVLVVSEEVFMRYFFSRPHVWAAEVVEYPLLLIACLGGGYVFLHNAHVKVDIVHRRLSPRLRATVDLITHLSVFALCYVLVWYGGKAAYMYFLAGTVSPEWGVIMWPGKMMVSVAGVLLGFQVLAKWIRDWFMAVAGVELKSRQVAGEGGLME